MIQKSKENQNRLILMAIWALMVFLPLPNANSQDMSAEAVWTFDPALDIYHVETADLNDDGFKDIIAAEYSNNSYGAISLVYGINGLDGSQLWSYTINDGIRSMTVADLNNDGVVDAIAGASYNSGDTPDGRIHAIDGTDGSQLWTYTIAATINCITTGNFNGDAYLDVAAGSFDDFIYAVNGETGALLWSQEIDAMWINDVDADDVNDDGIDDVVYAHEYLANYDNYHGVLDGTDGSAIWELIVPYLVMTSVLYDIDNDGVLEAIFGVIYSDDHGEVMVKTALDGTLEWSFNLGTVNHSNGDIVLGIEDLDEDGDKDLVVATYLGDHVVYAFDGTIDSPMWASSPLDGNVRDIAFGDVTGDKDMKVIMASSDRVEVLNGLDGSDVWDYSVAGTMQSVAIYDIDGDEILEVAAGGGADHSGNDPGKGVWALRTVQSPLLWEYAFGEYGNALAIGDFNDDGFDDVVSVASIGDNAVAVNGETGLELWTWSGTENLYAVTTGDFSGDGIADVAVGGNDDAVTAVYGTSGGLMWQFATPSDQIYRKCLAAADVTHDGVEEVIAGADDNYVYAIQTDTKSAVWATDVGGAVGDIEVADMDGISTLDVVVAVTGGPAGEKVVVLDGADGSVLWTYHAASSVEHIAVLDANDDGVMDVAAAITPYAPEGIVVINGADQTVIWSVPIDIPSNTNGIATGDLNDDKVQEVIVPGTSTTKTVTALDGIDGSVVWTFPTGSEVNCVMVSDVDLNGINDVVAGSDDQYIYAIDGTTGLSLFEYACADDVMDVGVGDISNNGLPNMACVTFGSDGVVYAFASLATGLQYICGDVNGDELVNILDVVFLIAYLYQGGPAPEYLEAADVNFDASINILDITYAISFLYQGGPDPTCE